MVVTMQQNSVDMPLNKVPTKPTIMLVYIIITHQNNFEIESTLL